jgi:hypothetical protein
VARTSAHPPRLVDYFVATPVRAYGFFVALAFGGGGGIFMLLLFGIFMFELAGGAMFAGFGVAVFAGLVMLALAFSFTTAVAQPAAKMPRAALAISAAIFNLVMKPPLLVSGYRALEKNCCSMIS